MPRYKIKVESSQQVAQVWVPISAMSEAEVIRISQARCAGRDFSPDLNTITQINESDYQQLVGKAEKSS